MGKRSIHPIIHPGSHSPSSELHPSPAASTAPSEPPSTSLFYKKKQHTISFFPNTSSCSGNKKHLHHPSMNEEEPSDPFHILGFSPSQRQLNGWALGQKRREEGLIEKDLVTPSTVGTERWMNEVGEKTNSECDSSSSVVAFQQQRDWGAGVKPILEEGGASPIPSVSLSSIKKWCFEPPTPTHKGVEEKEKETMMIDSNIDDGPTAASSSESSKEGCCEPSTPTHKKVEGEEKQMVMNDADHAGDDGATAAATEAVTSSFAVPHPTLRPPDGWKDRMDEMVQWCVTMDPLLVMSSNQQQLLQ